jgi:hypothetical protein
MSSFQNGRRRGVFPRVAERDVNAARTAPGEQFQAFAVQNDKGFAGVFAANFHVAPAELRANAGAKSLGDGFLGRKSGGQKWAGDFVGETVGRFGGMKDAVQESFAMPFARGFNAIHFDKVYAAA